MTQNHASKFESKVQESFKIKSLTQNAINRDYDFVGVNAINIYSVDTVQLGNYNKSGANRYGSPTDLGTTKQTLTLSQDKSFSMVIDKRDNMDSMNVLNPGSALQREIEDVVIPAIDKYRIDVIVKGKGKQEDVEVTKANAYETFLGGVTHLLDKGVPLEGAFAYISSEFYKAIRLDSSFIQPSDMAQEMLVKGVVGMVEGIPLIHVPSTYFPTDFDSSKKVNFVITNNKAVLGAEKLIEYKTHDNPPGINGWLIEGRLCYDAFVLNKKKDMIYLCATPS
ncbi:major capsid protein [Clostridium phage XP41-N3]|nr:major capsid protein [Clostridium phage XP41-N3]